MRRVIVAAGSAGLQQAAEPACPRHTTLPGLRQRGGPTVLPEAGPGDCKRVRVRPRDESGPLGEGLTVRLYRSIAGLMVVVLALAVGLAALSRPSGLLSSAVYSLTFGLLTASLWGVATRRGRRRVAWAGFAVPGWCYFALCFGTLGDPHREVLSRALVTSRLWDQAYEQLHPGGGEDSPPFVVWDQFARRYVKTTRHASSLARREDFWRTGHCLTALAIASLGALLTPGRPGTLAVGDPNPDHDGGRSAGRTAITHRG